MEKNENVARLLKSIWLNGGEIAPAAFTLRPNIRETYISVLREGQPTFRKDALEIAHRKSTKYAVLNAAELAERADSATSEEITYSVKETDNDRFKSHAGIFVAVNGNNIVGGEPFQQYLRQKGVSEETVLIGIAEQLAYTAQKNIKTIKA